MHYEIGCTQLRYSLYFNPSRNRTYIIYKCNILFCSRTSSIVASYTIQKQIKIIKKIFSMNLKFHNYESDFRI